MFDLLSDTIEISRIDITERIKLKKINQLCDK